MSRKVSRRQTEANRRNALQSTGPKSTEGKTRSSQNAATHSLSNPLAKAHFLHSSGEISSTCRAAYAQSSSLEQTNPTLGFTISGQAPLALQA